ncbi:MAG: 4-hydroxy-tetrahydrodipicolinate synthase [Bacillota bacterium]|nr:4-hydroxy-tetrahydrodipicolinate synthase [Bacillota bacterium]
MQPEELRKRLQGVFTVVVTPFRPDYELDTEGLKRNLDFLIANGVHGLIIGGSLGEFSSLSMEERRLLFRTAVDHVAGRLPVVVCTSHSNTREAVELTSYAHSIGADGVMVTAPYYAHRPEEGIVRHYRAVADAADIGILVYNTSRAGVNLSPKLISRLAEIPRVVGVKQGTRDISEQDATVRLVGHKIRVFSGSEVMMLPCFALGAVGTTSVSSSFMPQVMLECYNAAMEGDLCRAVRAFDGWAEYRLFASAHGQPATVKAAMQMVGLAAGPVRLPMLDLPEEARGQLRSILRNMGLIP